MSSFLSEKYRALRAYTPGEQPRDRRYIKLNTNESPFAPPPSVLQAVSEEAERLQLYCDPTCSALVQAAAQTFGVSADMLLPTNGSDEILQYAFMAFGDAEHPFAFPDLTYGFYPVFCDLYGIPYRAVPLREDFTLDVQDYDGHRGPIVIANPNAPTGLLLPLEDIEYLLKNHPDSPVIVDEAYIDFGGESALPLLSRYGNLLITRTFSKSFSMAGARLGFGIGSPTLIRDLNLMKYSTNPYNVNRMTQAAGVAALRDIGYFRDNCRRIASTRERCADALREMGFFVTDSRANFLFVKHGTLGGEALYTALRERGILVRHLSGERIRDFNRITVGSGAEMDALLLAVRDILAAAEA